MTDIYDAARRALEALEWSTPKYGAEITHADAITALQSALKGQGDAVPVVYTDEGIEAAVDAWFKTEPRWIDGSDDFAGRMRSAIAAFHAHKAPVAQQPEIVANEGMPPGMGNEPEFDQPREWVGLTDEEVWAIWNAQGNDEMNRPAAAVFADDIEQALRRKNEQA